MFIKSNEDIKLKYQELVLKLEHCISLIYTSAITLILINNFDLLKSLLIVIAPSKFNKTPDGQVYYN